MTYRSTAILCFLGLWYTNVLGQSTFFNKTYDVEQWDAATSVLQIDDGYLVVGRSVTTQSAMVELIRLDSNGDSIWTKLYGQAPEARYSGSGRSFIKTYDGGFAFCGSIEDSLGSNLHDVLFMKFDSVGDTMWTKRYGGGCPRHW